MLPGTTCFRLASVSLPPTPHRMATTAIDSSVSETEYTATNVLLHTPLSGGYRRTARAPLNTATLPFYPREYREAVPQFVGASTAGRHDRAARLLQLLVAGFALVLTAPLFLLIAVAIKATSRGSIFYRQVRIGIDRRRDTDRSHDDVRIKDLGGRPFTMLKFRTMVLDAEKDDREVWACRGDGRITPVGRVLRASRLDELPQLLNVLAGEMNIVGPRPERPGIFAELRQTIPNYHLRQAVMPGITGWAQVNQSYDTCVDDVRRKVDFDLEYLRTRGLRRDLAIMARTVPVMVLCNHGW